MKPSHFITPRSLDEATFSGRGPISAQVRGTTGLDIAFWIVSSIVLGVMLGWALAS